MQPKRARGRRTSLIVALCLAVAAILPAPSLAAAPEPAQGVPRSDAEVVLRPFAVERAADAFSEWLIDATVDEHPADRPMVIRGTVIIWRFEARRAALQVIAAVRAEAVREAAAEAEAAKLATAAKATSTSKAAVYAGRNHVWIPSLGVSRAVETFACTRSSPPANRVYRWGCAGTNNVYLFGHAWGVMKPLHDAYVQGRLHAGMTVLYADDAGRVRTYRVTEYRVVTPDQASWAIAAQPVPSMTLQTCIGAKSDRRLLVRLVADS